MSVSLAHTAIRIFYLSASSTNHSAQHQSRFFPYTHLYPFSVSVTELVIPKEPLESDESGEDSDDNGDDEVDLDDDDDDDGLVIDLNPQDRLIDDSQGNKGDGVQRRPETYDIHK